METIRDAQPREAAALEALQRRASDVWPEYREQLAAHPDAIEVSAEAIRTRQVRVAADAAGQPVGFSLVVPGDDAAVELDGLFVEPERMGTGVGRRLVADAAATARRAGATRMDVVANPNALGFYTKVGFRGADAVRTRFGAGVRMHLELEE